MKISIAWIREFCPFPLSDAPRQIGVRFSLATAEVEGVEARGEGLDRVLVARVLEVRPHPGADQLRLARIEAGPRREEVVCGAPNVRPGILVPYAPPGSVVGGREIRIAKIRGVESPGMLCSEAELGLSEEGGGLWELPAETPTGSTIAAAFPELCDIVLEVDNKSLTHRPDLWGHYGVAREFSAIYGAPLRPYAVREELARQGGDSGVRVSIASEPAGSTRPRCPRYVGLRVDGVNVGPSPDWIGRRLQAVGLRPISNVVDVTNLVMLELGQPLHAFDVAQIRGGEIHVRRAAAGESLKLLDGSTAALSSQDLVIADREGPVALAGVMGGERSGISDATTSVFIESANFDAAGVRRSSIRTVRTDSSARFEKALDPELARLAILRAAGLLLDLCPGARVVGPLQDVGYTPRAPITIHLSPAAVAQRLGAPIDASRTRGILTALGFTVQEAARGTDSPHWEVRVPSWRATKDVSIFEDLVEEVGRLYGYDNIPPGPPLWPVVAPSPNPTRKLERRAREFLARRGGLNELMTYAMVGAAHCRAFGLDPEAHLKLQNPMSEDLDRMRREITPVHLEKARENLRFFKEFGFFELGRVYRKEPAELRSRDLPRETSRLAGLLQFSRKDVAHFYTVRSLVLDLLRHLERGEAGVEPLAADRTWIHPRVGGEVRLGGASVGIIYRVHPATARRLELEGDTICFDLDFDAIAALPQRESRYRKLPRFPFVTFDVAVVAPEQTEARAVEAVIRAAAGEVLRSLAVFDVYQGPNLPPGKKSLAFQIAVGADDRTLGSAEAEAVRARVTAALAGCGYQLRG